MNAIEIAKNGPEIWKTFPYNSLYEVSNLGRVRRGKRILGGGMMTSGYRHVTICDGIKKKIIGIHRLVAMTFHGEPEGRDTNHKDGDKLNNRADNLEWLTRSENLRHAHDNGLHWNGTESHLWKKLTPEDVREIRQLAGTMSQAKIGKKFSISQTYVGKIIHRTKWRQLK